MYLRGLIICCTLCLGYGAIPRWQVQIPYNDIAHLFHSMYCVMYIPFETTNQTAGSIVMQKMEECLEGVKELNHLTDVTPEQEFHVKYLRPVVFMIVRGRKQWNLISYTNSELSEKYGWDETTIERFREIYREILDLVNEMEQMCTVRHIKMPD